MLRAKEKEQRRDRRRRLLQACSKPVALLAAMLHLCVLQHIRQYLTRILLAAEDAASASWCRIGAAWPCSIAQWTVQDGLYMNQLQRLHSTPWTHYHNEPSWMATGQIRPQICWPAVHRMWQRQSEYSTAGHGPRKGPWCVCHGRQSATCEIELIAGSLRQAWNSNNPRPVSRLQKHAALHQAGMSLRRPLAASKLLVGATHAEQQVCMRVHCGRASPHAERPSVVKPEMRLHVQRT